MTERVAPVHMNGRIYDPKLGRMLQADPFIQSPTNSQSLNRYSYVLNNPLSYTDPSGYFSLKSVVKFMMKVSGTWTTHKFLNQYPVVSSIISGALNAIPGCQIWCSALFNASGAFVATGSLSAAFRVGAISYATGYISAGIGASGLNPYQQAFVAGMAGGITAELQGGKFGHGFLAAGIGFAAGTRTGGDPSIGKFVAASIVGGTVSELTGGKFANGAATAAMGYVAASLLTRSRDLTDTRASEMSDAEFASVFGTPDEWYAFEWGDPLPQWSVDLAAGFGDTFGAGYLRGWLGIDGGIDYDSGYYLGGQVVGTFTPGLGTAAALRTGAFLGGTKTFRIINGNRYMRMGPGRMPASAGMQAGPKVPRLSIGRGPGNPHFDLRARPFDN